MLAQAAGCRLPAACQLPSRCAAVARWPQQSAAGAHADPTTPCPPPRSHPTNLILLGAFTALEGVAVGAVSAQYALSSVALAVAVTAGVAGSLAAYAARTKTDYTARGGMLLSALTALILTGFLALFTRSSAAELMISGVGALIFGACEFCLTSRCKKCNMHTTVCCKHDALCNEFKATLHIASAIVAPCAPGYYEAAVLLKPYTHSCVPPQTSCLTSSCSSAARGASS